MIHLSNNNILTMLCSMQVQQRTTHRAQSLLKEKYQEATTLQAKIKQLAKVRR